MLHGARGRRSTPVQRAIRDASVLEFCPHLGEAARMRANLILTGLSIGALAWACKSSEPAAPAAPSAPATAAPAAPAAPAITPLDDRGLLAARPARRKESVRYGAMTQDNLFLAARCGDEVRVPVMVGVLDLPYDNPKGFVAVAEVAAEQALAREAAPEGCAWREASYWARDEAGRGDWVVRYPVTPGLGTQVLWVPDQGDPVLREATSMPRSAFVARLLRVASYQADVAEDAEKALGLIAAARALDPASRQAVELLGELLIGEDSALAVREIDAFAKEHGADADLEATLATALLDVGTEQATARGEALLEDVLSRDPVNLKALAARGERLRAKGDAAGAIAAYEKAVAAHPLDPSPRYNLATLLLAAGRGEEAMAHLDAYLLAFSEDPDALFLRAGLRLGRAELDGARGDLEVLRRVAPGDPQVEGLAAQIEEAARGGAGDAGGGAAPP